MSLQAASGLDGLVSVRRSGSDGAERSWCPVRPFEHAGRQPVGELRDDGGACPPGVVVHDGAVGEGDGVGGERPHPLVALANLVLRDCVPTGPDAEFDALDCEFLGHKQATHDDTVPSALARVMRSSLDGWENTVSTMNGSPRDIS